LPKLLTDVYCNLRTDTEYNLIDKMQHRYWRNYLLLNTVDNGRNSQCT